jgi:hypothetical protein
MKPDLRISIKDYHRNKSLKIQLSRLPYGNNRQFWVKMNGELWPKDGRAVSLTRLLTALRTSLVKYCNALPPSLACKAVFINL